MNKENGFQYNESKSEILPMEYVANFEDFWIIKRIIFNGKNNVNIIQSNLNLFFDLK